MGGRGTSGVLEFFNKRLCLINLIDWIIELFPALFFPYIKFMPEDNSTVVFFPYPLKFSRIILLKEELVIIFLIFDFFLFISSLINNKDIRKSIILQ